MFGRRLSAMTSSYQLLSVFVVCARQNVYVVALAPNEWTQMLRKCIGVENLSTSDRV